MSCQVCLPGSSFQLALDLHRDGTPPYGFALLSIVGNILHRLRRLTYIKNSFFLCKRFPISSTFIALTPEGIVDAVAQSRT